MATQRANLFFEKAFNALGFLVNDYSFAPPYLEIDDSIGFAIVTFMGKNLAIECLLEEREGDIDCKVARVVNGKKTDHYAVDDKGVVVRESLVSLLRRRGVGDRLFEEVGGLELDERMAVTLNDFARILKNHGDVILSDSRTALA